MEHVAPFAAPRESIYSVLASIARRLTSDQLSAIALLSGVMAAAAAITHHASWMLLSTCYIAWCFAGWGILFHSPMAPRTAVSRGLQLVIAASASGVFAALAVGVFFWALGPSWKL